MVLYLRMSRRSGGARDAQASGARGGEMGSNAPRPRNRRNEPSRGPVASFQQARAKSTKRTQSRPSPTPKSTKRTQSRPSPTPKSTKRTQPRPPLTPKSRERTESRPSPTPKSMKRTHPPRGDHGHPARWSPLPYWMTTLVFLVETKLNFRLILQVVAGVRRVPLAGGVGRVPGGTAFGPRLIRRAGP
jgi:hypothetical protein